MTEKIPSSAISVVIQGPLNRDKVDPDTGLDAMQACIKSVATALPQAEIILSTWQGEKVDNFENCKMIVSEMPPHILDLNGHKNNINRQLCSTIAGIQAASRSYILKMRSDLCLHNDVFCKLSAYEAEENSAHQLFNSPVNVTNIFTRDPTKTPMLFHLSDMVHFGRAEDISDLWSHPLFSETYMKQANGPVKNPVGNFAGYTSMRLVPEQALTLAWLNKHNINVDIAHICDMDFDRFTLWEQVLFMNFRIFSWQQSGITFPDRFTQSKYTQNRIYSLGTLNQMAQSEPRVRYRKAWLNRYVFFLFHRIWYVSTGSILLFSLNRPIALRVRAMWRRLSGWRKS